MERIKNLLLTRKQGLARASILIGIYAGIILAIGVALKMCANLIDLAR